MQDIENSPKRKRSSGNLENKKSKKVKTGSFEELLLVDDECTNSVPDIEGMLEVTLDEKEEPCIYSYKNFDQSSEATEIQVVDLELEESSQTAGNPMKLLSVN